MLSFVLNPPDWVKSGFELSFCENEFKCDVLKTVDGGCPFGVNEFADEGGCPAGVVEILQALCLLSLSGVAGGLES